MGVDVDVAVGEQPELAAVGAAETGIDGDNPDSAAPVPDLGAGFSNPVDREAVELGAFASRPGLGVSCAVGAEVLVELAVDAIVVVELVGEGQVGVHAVFSSTRMRAVVEC